MPMSTPICVSKTALVLIDLQNGIVALPLVPYSGVQVVQRGAALAEAFRHAGALVIYVRVDLAALHDQAVDRPTHDPAAPPPAIVSELTSEAGYRDGDELVTKRQWGAFEGTGLDQILRDREIKTIVLGGITTNFGVESTARAAFDRGYDVVFASDVMASVDADAHRFAIEEVFPFMGRVMTASDIQGALLP